MAVEYEWDVETVYDGTDGVLEDGEVFDHDPCSTYKEAAEQSKTPARKGFRHKVVLVRDDNEGRSWAYVVAGNLPEYFQDAEGADRERVPQRFVREVAKWRA